LKSDPLRPFALGILIVGLTTSCVYFNAMYDAGNAYDEGLDALQEGQGSTARLQFDSVIAKTGRIVRSHPDSKWADDAALLKTRSEIHNKLWAAAFGSSALALRLSGNPRDSATAFGLGGVAALQLAQPRQSDSMLSLALAGDLTGDDRATFLFHRVLARMETGRTAAAAVDLQTAAEQIDLTREARLELARALRQIGEYERSADVTADILTFNEFGLLSPAERAHVDSLSALAPAVLEPRLGQLVASPDLQPSMTAMLQMLRGQALENLADSETAIVVLDSAATVGSSNRWAQEASLRASMIRIRNAREPGEIQETLPALDRAKFSSATGVRDTATQMARATLLFGEFTKAWESRGSSAAEAALRAAELAGTELGSPAVARGLYLKYLELAPESPWAVKAIYGALAFSGQQPGDWVRDDGAATDQDLLDRINAVPADNPYRLALAEEMRDTWADSSYVLAEVDLERRISEIQMLFDTTVVRVRRDTAQIRDEPDEPDAGVSAERDPEP
jgi:tetratricopeptide (TPR) repeat protein